MNWLNVISISKKRYTINSNQIVYVDMDYYITAFSDKGVRIVLSSTIGNLEDGLGSINNEVIICDGEEADSVRLFFGYGEQYV